MTAPSVGQVRQKIVTEKVLSPAEAAREVSGASPDFWDYVETLKEPADWDEHTLYIYREDPRVSTYSTEPAYLWCSRQGDKVSDRLEVPAMAYRTAYFVPLNDRDLLVDGIRERFGGRAFRLMIKKGSQRIAIGKCVIDAEPKYPATMPLPSTQQPQTADSSVGAVAQMAMQTVSSKEAEGIKIATEALRAASDIIRTQHTQLQRISVFPRRVPRLVRIYAARRADGGSLRFGS